MAAKSVPYETVAAIVHMRPKLARLIRGLDRPTIPTPALTPPARVGERLFLVEWAGAMTGRADLVRIESTDPRTATCVVFRSWCWATGKHDTDLKDLSLTVDEKRAIPLIGDP
jgi:hypothetical protein